MKITVTVGNDVHEVKVPDDVEAIQIWEETACGEILAIIPLPPSKKKVKKWHWVMHGGLQDNSYWVTASRYSEKDIETAFVNARVVQKVTATMIEVEE